MTLHDAAITRLGQWRRRATRSGYAYALGVAMHGRGPERHWVREVASILLWAAALPLAGIMAAGMFGWPSLALLAAYPLQWARIAVRHGRRTGRWREGGQYAGFILLAKLAQLVGIGGFVFDRLRKRSARIIEYRRVNNVAR